MRLTVIVSRQRAGSTGLTSALDRLEGITSFGEIFHHVGFEKHEGNAEALYVTEEALFLPFRTNLFGTHLELSAPTLSNQTKIFDLYLDHLKTLTKSKHIVVDIKYNSWHHLNHIYHQMWEPPVLYHLLKRRGAVFIHLKRRNKFLRYVSEQISLKTHIWHSADELNDAASPLLTIDPKLALEDMISTSRYEDYFDKFLKSNTRSVRMFYEEMYENQGFSAMTKYSLKDVFPKIDVSNMATPLKKLNKTPRQLIGNSQDLLDFFENTQYAASVRAAM